MNTKPTIGSIVMLNRPILFATHAVGKLGVIRSMDTNINGTVFLRVHLIEGKYKGNWLWGDYTLGDFMIDDVTASLVL